VRKLKEMRELNGKAHVVSDFTNMILSEKQPGAIVRTVQLTVVFQSKTQRDGHRYSVNCNWKWSDTSGECLYTELPSSHFL